MSIDLKGNTNYVGLKNLQDEYIVPRTNLAAVDMVVANGLTLDGNVLSVSIATADDITYGTTGHLVDAVGLSACLADKADAFSVGDLLENTSGTLNRKRYMNIVQEANIPTRSVTPIGSTVARTALVLEPGNAYKITATSTTKWLATTAAFKAEQNTWGLEGHIELFVAGTGYVHTDDNVVLATPLEPDAVNNCTVRFHDGKAIISVEDTIAGYIVVTATGSSNGSLAYGLANNVGEYISFNDALAGTTIDLGGVTTYAGEKHVVGNGYTDTVVSGSINCTSKTTFANLSLSDVQVVGGTMTLGDAYIPSGSTVAVSGGGLAVEKVTGAGSESVIDLGGTHIYSLNDAISIANVTLTSGTGSTENAGGAVYLFNAEATINGVTITGNTATAGGGVSLTRNKAVLNASNSYIKGNRAIVSGAPATSRGDDVYITSGAIFNALGGCEIGGCALASNGGITFAGSNKIDSIEPRSASVGNGGFVTLTSGATLDLTGNANATPINPGGGVTFESGGATVLYSSGAVSGSYMMDNVTLPAGAKLTNTAVIDLAGSNVRVSPGSTVSADGCTFTGGGNAEATSGGALYVNNGSLMLTSVVLSGNNSISGGALYVQSTGNATLIDCDVRGNTGTGNIYVNSGAVAISGGYCESVRIDRRGACTLGGNVGVGTIQYRTSAEGRGGTVTISSGASINLTNLIAPGGTGDITVLTGGCVVNGVEVAGGTYTSIVSSGGSAVVNE